MERVKWKQTKYGRDCTFTHNGNAYSYISTEEGYDILDDENRILASSDKEKQVIGFSSEDLTFLYQLATELEIQFIQLDNGMIFYPDSAYGWVQDKPIINIVNLARLVSKGEFGENVLFWIYKDRAYINGDDFTDLLVRRSKFYALKDNTTIYGVKHKFQKCTIFSELQAGYKGDCLNELLSHLYSNTRLDVKVHLNRFSSITASYSAENSFVVRGFKFSPIKVSTVNGVCYISSNKYRNTIVEATIEKVKRKVLFINRDGTLNRDKVEAHRKEDLELFPDTIRFLLYAQKIGYEIVIVTNQSGIGKGHYTIQDMKKFNDYLLEKLGRAGINILDLFYCPHTAQDNCKCMKPKPGMLLQAKEKYNLDMKDCVMIGDQALDMYAGLNAGVNNLILVTTDIYKRGICDIPRDLQGNIIKVSSLTEIIKYNLLEKMEVVVK